jgi:DNA (cytosine-5)-methyltransferase 1
MIEKPPYRVPLMSEIARIKPNGLKVISTFAGGGGSSLGYRMAGFKVLWASEFIDAARDVYQANAAPGTIVDGRDIREVDPVEIMRTVGIAPGELDILDGSPPCLSFSTAGKREAGWGEVKKYSDKAQRTDDLFFEFIRFVRAIRPKVFVAENVSGLVKGTAKGYFIEILREMKACGYRVNAQLLDAQWLGVPQQRQRIIFVGVRDDLGIEPVHPKPLPYRYSVRDAIGGLDGRVTTKRTRRSLDDPPTIMTHNRKGTQSEIAIERSVERETDISSQAIGREYDKLNPGEQSEKYFSLVRTDENEPCPTVTAAVNSGIATVTHPTEKRKFSIAELKRICAFPDDAVLTGTYAQQWERLGRAVPPVMMMYIAKEIRDKILLPLQERERCAGLQPSGSGQRSKKGSRKIAGRGEDPRPGAVMDTSGSGMSAGSSRRTSSRSKRSLAGA